MWIWISFDLPAKEARKYRQLRKKLLENGFIFLQKSCCMRWADNQEKAAAIKNRLEKCEFPGDIWLLEIPECAFGRSLHWIDGKLQEKMLPPDPWIIV